MVLFLTPATNDMPTKYGSKIYEKYNKPGLDASVVALCREQGAIILGKTVRVPDFLRSADLLRSLQSLRPPAMYSLPTIQLN
jgi:hypothetical protein